VNPLVFPFLLDGGPSEMLVLGPLGRFELHLLEPVGLRIKPTLSLCWLVRCFLKELRVTRDWLGQPGTGHPSKLLPRRMMDVTLPRTITGSGQV
jgi:hypothetical protein